MKETKRYRVSLGFKKWIYFDVKATSYGSALRKARKRYEDGKDYIGTGYERQEDFDTVEVAEKEKYFYRCNKRSCPICICALSGKHADKYKRFTSEEKNEDAPCYVGLLTPTSFKHPVQIIDNDSIHKLAIKQYPNLYMEVIQQDKISKSSWYDLSDFAFEQFKKFKRSMIKKGIWGGETK